jgi:hypothetical protein
MFALPRPIPLLVARAVPFVAAAGPLIGLSRPPDRKTIAAPRVIRSRELTVIRPRGPTVGGPRCLTGIPLGGLVVIGF